jgi:hypothetical protein
VPWPRSELPKHKLAQNRNAVAPVQRNGTDVEDTRNSSVRAETNQVDGNAEEHRDPNSVQWRSGHRVDFCPYSGEGQETITGESEDCSAKGLHGCEADELDNNQAGNRKKDSATFSEAVVEDLSDGLVNWAGEDHGRVTLCQILVSVVPQDGAEKIHTMQKQRTMLKRKPARYVKSMAIEIAHGALISGWLISSVICAVAS